jgi:hypothetical protein
MPIEALLPGDHQDGGQRRAASFVVSGISLRSFPKQRNVQKLLHIPKHNELTLYNVRYPDSDLLLPVFPFADTASARNADDNGGFA